MIEIINVFAYHGPNLFVPRPGVLLRIRCDIDCSKRIKDALKDGAQFIGLVMAYLDVSAIEHEGTYVISVNFTTPMPEIGSALATFVVEGIRAEIIGDEDWNRDSLLFALQQQCRRQTPGMPVLQLITQARQRGLPVIKLPDGHIQFGYGIRSWTFQPSTINQEEPTIPPWDELGFIPIYAITGEKQRSPMVHHIASFLGEGEHPWTILDDADYDATLSHLANPATCGLVVGLNTADILRRGLAFDRCTVSIITDREGTKPSEAFDETEWVKALGVPLLISTSPAMLNSKCPYIATLAAWAPHGVQNWDGSCP